MGIQTLFTESEKLAVLQSYEFAKLTCLTHFPKCIRNPIVKEMDQKKQFKLFLETPDYPVDPKHSQSLDFTNT